MNPIKELRNQLNLTQSDLADLSGVSSQGILRYEQSLYEEPSSRIVDALVAIHAQITGSDPPPGEVRKWLIEQYRANRREIQINSSHLFRHPHDVITKPNEHPFVTWRTAVLDSPSRMRFCTLLAIHPSPLAEYEKGHRRYMPRMLTEALSTASVGKDLLERLNYAGSIYYDDIKHGRILVHD